MILAIVSRKGVSDMAKKTKLKNIDEVEDGFRVTFQTRGRRSRGP